MRDSNINNNNEIDINNSLKLFILKQIKNERELTQNKINILLTYSQKQIFNFFLSTRDKSDTDIDKKSVNSISSKSIVNKFNTFKEKDIKQIIKLYDKDNDSLLNYKEFYYFLSPKYIDTNIDELRTKRKNNSENKELNDICINILYNIFQIEINNLNELSYIMFNIISNINLITDNHYLYLFKLIKGNDKEYDYLNEFILINDVLTFINKNIGNEKYDIKIYEQDVANLIFRFDYDNDLKLSFIEFKNMINYFINNNNNNEMMINTNNERLNKTENNKLGNRNIGKLFYDYSSLNIDTTNGSQFNTMNKIEEPSFDLSKHIEEKLINEQARIINENRQNSFLNNVSVTYNDLSDVLSSLINNNKNSNFANIDINSVINYKAKELQDLKINLLIEFFKTLINELNEIELNKQKIAKEFNINLPDLFSLFDCNKEKNISSNNLISVFNKYFNKNFKENDFKYIIKKYDQNKDNKLNYTEFCHMILPNNVEYKKILEKNYLNKKTINEYTEKEKKIILSLFLSLIKCEDAMQAQKIKLINTPLFTYFEMFEFIRNKTNKLLTSDDILEFLKNNQVLIIKDQMDILLNYLFFSSEKDKTYNFRDFMRIIQPF